MMDIHDELLKASTDAYNFEQEIMRKNLHIDRLMRRIILLEKEVERLQGVQVESTCDECGTIFIQRNKGRIARYCSASCRQAHYKSNKEFARVMAKESCATD